MPELPEVECIRKGIVEQFLQQKILKTWFGPLPNLLDPTSQPLKHIKGQVLQKVERRGKYLLFLFDDWQLLAHLGMSGVWQVNAEKQKHTHLEWQFENGKKLSYTDPRRFGYLSLHSLKDPLPRWEALGPDAISSRWTPEHLYTSTRKIHTAIKIFLMDQSKVAGIGNIYASEALFLSGIHPERAADSLSMNECKILVRESCQVLKRSIRNKGTTFSDYRLTNGKGGAFQGFLKVFQKTGQPCPLCGKAILMKTLGGRSTFYCESCQK